MQDVKPCASAPIVYAYSRAAEHRGTSQKTMASPAGANQAAEAREPSLSASSGKKTTPPAPRPLGRIGTSHRAIGVAEVRAGDVCFFYRHEFTHYMHRLILLAQSTRRALTFFETVRDPSTFKKPRIMHCGIVTSVNAKEGSITLAEASGSQQRVVESVLHLRPGATGLTSAVAACDYLFYRIRDEQVASGTARWAKAISQHAELEYAITTARTVAFRSPWLGLFGRRRLQKIAEVAGRETMTPADFGRMMCSEFVVTCGVAASLHGAALLAGQSEAADVHHLLGKTASGKAFRLDPATTMPMALHEHFIKSEGIAKVGFIRSRGDPQRYAAEPRTATGG